MNPSRVFGQGVPVLVPMTAFTLTGSWTAYGAPFEGPGYYQDGAGVVHLYGLMHNGTKTSGTVVATVPAGLRPANTHTFITLCSDTDQSAYVAVNAAGQVLLGALLATNSYLSLDGIAYLAEQ